MKIFFTFILITIPFIQSVAQDYYSNNLIGINSFVVGVEVDEGLKEAGLYFPLLKNNVELKFRTQAIKVIDVDSDEFPDAELRIRIKGVEIPSTETIIFSYQVALCEFVSVDRLKKTDKYYATTWSFFSGGYKDKDIETEKFISDAIMEILDVFLNNYFRDNPKKGE